MPASRRGRCRRGAVLPRLPLLLGLPREQGLRARPGVRDAGARVRGRHRLRADQQARGVRPPLHLGGRGRADRRTRPSRSFWGWGPALAWIVLGTIFAAGVHDFGSLAVSVRHKAKNIGTLARDVINARARTLFLLIIFFLLTLVNAVFAVVIGNLFVANPGAVIPIVVEIPLAIFIGQYIYRTQSSALIPSIVGVIVLYVLIRVGQQVPLDIAPLADGARLRQPAQPVGGAAVRLHLGGLPPPGVGAAAAARLHQQPPAVHRARRHRARHDRRQEHDRGAGRERRTGGVAVGLPVPVHHDRLRRDLRLPLLGVLGHDVQADRQGDRRPLRRLHGCRRRGQPGHRCGARRDRGRRGDAGRLGRALPRLRHRLGRRGRQLRQRRRRCSPTTSASRSSWR